MPLPENDTAWPPAAHTDRLTRMRAAKTWWGGDPAKLSALYGGGATTVRTGFGAALGNAFGWFWGRSSDITVDEKVHVPLAADIATMSSELLFAESPRFEVQHSLFTADGTPDAAQSAEVARTQARLDYILDRIGFDALLLAAAETQSPLGAVALRIGYSKLEGSVCPSIARVDADHYVADYVWGELRAVTFWRELQGQGSSQKWLHLERHEPGRIEHALYVGTDGNIGKRVPLADHPETASLAQLVDSSSGITMVADRMTAVSIPNALPDALDSESLAGRSDFTPGVLTLFDAIDKTMTSLMRDIEDGQSRLLIADYMLESRGAGKGVGFDNDQRMFTRLKRQPGETADAPIDQVQFKIRVNEHLATLDDLTRRAVKACGYNPESQSGDGGAAMTATEYSGKASRSMQTRRKKLRYWQIVEQLLETLLQVDALYFQSGITALPVKMVVPNAATPSLKELAETVNLLKQAESASVRVRVTILHPDWDETQIDAEVDEIMQSSSVIDPATFGIPGAPLDSADDADTL